MIQSAEPWATSVTALLVVSLCLYVILGGADFGAGILEATLPSHLRSRLGTILAPVWEANHVWLIAVVVLLFVGFPVFYATALTRLYVPISLSLLAILLRGVFFTLRKYDPDPRRLATTYSTLFRVSSAGAPLMFGFVLGGLLTEHPGAPRQLPTDTSFWALYMQPWLHPFGLLCGAFLMSLFGYLAAVFFYGDVVSPQKAPRSPDAALVSRRAAQFFAATFVLGGLVLLTGSTSGRVPLRQALDPLFLICQAAALLGIFGVAVALRRDRIWQARFWVGAQVSAILGGWFSAQYPVLLHTQAGPLEIADAAAPPVTLFWLSIGYLVVLSLVAPLLVFLFRVFQAHTVQN